jgi:hypothetical protein
VNAAAAVASAPVSVVEALGTAVHRWPSIDVMENPAGRFAFVDMAKTKSDACRCRECINQPSRDMEITDQRRPGHQFTASTIASTMFSKIERRTEIHLEENGERGWMDGETYQILGPQTPAFRRESGVGVSWEGEENGGQGARLEGLLGGVSACSRPLH